jgi:hypothetical protein
MISRILAPMPRREDFLDMHRTPWESIGTIHEEAIKTTSFYFEHKAAHYKLKRVKENLKIFKLCSWTRKHNTSQTILIYRLSSGG